MTTNCDSISGSSGSNHNHIRSETTDNRTGLNRVTRGKSYQHGRPRHTNYKPHHSHQHDGERTGENSSDRNLSDGRHPRFGHRYSHNRSNEQELSWDALSNYQSSEKQSSSTSHGYSKKTIKSDHNNESEKCPDDVGGQEDGKDPERRTYSHGYNRNSHGITNGQHFSSRRWSQGYNRSHILPHRSRRSDVKQLDANVPGDVNGELTSDKLTSEEYVNTKSELKILGNEEADEAVHDKLSRHQKRRTFVPSNRRIRRNSGELLPENIKDSDLERAKDPNSDRKSLETEFKTRSHYKKEVDVHGDRFKHNRQKKNNYVKPFPSTSNRSNRKMYPDQSSCSSNEKDLANEKMNEAEEEQKGEDVGEVVEDEVDEIEEPKECPLCLEPLDVFESSSFYPCFKCPYQICLFCFNKIQQETESNQSEGHQLDHGLCFECPGCRTPYKPLEENHELMAKYQAYQTEKSSGKSNSNKMNTKKSKDGNSVKEKDTSKNGTKPNLEKPVAKKNTSSQKKGHQDTETEDLNSLITNHRSNKNRSAPTKTNKPAFIKKPELKPRTTATKKSSRSHSRSTNSEEKDHEKLIVNGSNAGDSKESKDKTSEIYDLSKKDGSIPVVDRQHDLIGLLSQMGISNISFRSSIVKPVGDSSLSGQTSSVYDLSSEK